MTKRALRGLLLASVALVPGMARAQQSSIRLDEISVVATTPVGEVGVGHARQHPGVAQRPQHERPQGQPPRRGGRADPVAESGRDHDAELHLAGAAAGPGYRLRQGRLEGRHDAP